MRGNRKVTSNGRTFEVRPTEGKRGCRFAVGRDRDRSCGFKATTFVQTAEDEVWLCEMHDPHRFPRGTREETT